MWVDSAVVIRGSVVFGRIEYLMVVYTSTLLLTVIPEDVLSPALPKSFWHATVNAIAKMARILTEAGRGIRGVICIQVRGCE
jgi:hypothetical protein